VLLIALATVVIAAIIVLPSAVERGPLTVAMTLTAVTLAAALPLMALAGMLLRAPWRTEVAVLALGFLVIAGVFELLAAFSRGGTTIPFLALAALIPLVRRPAGWRGSASTPVAVAAVALGLAPFLWALVAGGLARPGSPFLVDESALELQLDVDCPADVSEAGSLVVAARWHWLRAEPLPWGVDALVLTTTLVIADDATTGYSLASLEVPAGSTQGEGPPSADRSAELAAEGNGTPAQVAIDLGGRGMTDGAVTARWTQTIDAEGSVTIQAGYAHGDAWTLRADAMTCAWPAP
jgi:hypothetical protein